MIRRPVNDWTCPVADRVGTGKSIRPQTSHEHECVRRASALAMGVASLLHGVSLNRSLECSLETGQYEVPVVASLDVLAAGSAHPICEVGVFEQHRHGHLELREAAIGKRTAGTFRLSEQHFGVRVHD